MFMVSFVSTPVIEVEVGVVAGGSWSSGVWGLEWWHVGVGVVAGVGSSGGVWRFQ